MLHTGHQRDAGDIKRNRIADDFDVGQPGEQVAEDHRQLAASEVRTQAKVRPRATETEVRVLQQRLNPASRSVQLSPAAIVLCRAVAPLPKLLDIVFPVISSSTCCIFLKGAAAGDEVSRARRKWQFQLESIQSRTSPDGVILKLSGIDQNGAAN